MPASPSPPLLLRPGVPADLPELQRLEAQFPGDRLSRRQLRHHLMQDDGRLRVALSRGSLVGYSLVLRPAGSRTVRLYSLVVDVSQRGKGIGQRLLCDVEEQATRAGARAIRLEVRADNAGASALYARAGFQRIGIRRCYYDDGMDAVRLEKMLETPVDP